MDEGIGIPNVPHFVDVGVPEQTTGAADGSQQPSMLNVPGRSGESQESDNTGAGPPANQLFGAILCS